MKTFRILPKALDPEEEGEPVTPTRKLKRAQMLERFKALVESMYDDREEQLVAAGIGDALKSLKRGGEPMKKTLFAVSLLRGRLAGRRRRTPMSSAFRRR